MKIIPKQDRTTVTANENGFVVIEQEDDGGTVHQVYMAPQLCETLIEAIKQAEFEARMQVTTASPSSPGLQPMGGSR